MSARFTKCFLNLQVQCKLSRKCEIHYISTVCMALGLRGDLPILSLDGNVVQKVYR